MLVMLVVLLLVIVPYSVLATVVLATVAFGPAQRALSFDVANFFRKKQDVRSGKNGLERA